jgi:hypothetical protein
MVVKEHPIATLWKRYRFTIMVFASLVFLLGMILYNDPWEEGSFHDTLYFDSSYFDNVYSVKTPRTHSKGESECRRVLETLLRKPFPSCRPKHLQNHITNQSLELDCFNEEIGLAVEYNGEQHYRFVPAFHKTRDAFHNQQYRDDIKKNLCREKGIDLIIVPYWIQVGQIQGFIEEKLRSGGYL